MIETLPEILSEPVTRIRPSEAIKLGRLTRPIKTPYHMFEGGDGACTFGALTIGILGPEYSDTITVEQHQTWNKWWISLPEPVRNYLQKIPMYFDNRIKNEEQIITELEEMGA